jgi:hypothetical protein
MILRMFLQILLLVPVACALPQELESAPPEGLEIAWFLDDCAPWDGPAVSLYLARRVGDGPFQPGFPHLHVALYEPATRLRGRGRIRLEVPGNVGHAQYCESAEDCSAGTHVRIEFSDSDPGILEGRLEVTFESRPPVRGGFRAVRMPFQALCG